MEIPVTAGPWLVLGLVVGVLLPVLGGLGVLALRRRSSRAETPPRPAPSAAGFGVDDLADFLESPPGSAPTSARAAGGWALLSSPPQTLPAPARPRRPERSETARTLVAMAVTALLLIGAAAAVATGRTGDRTDAAPQQSRREPGRSPEPPPPREVTARLAFDGIVLERHAVGVTVTYPRVRVTAEDPAATAEVELPTFNCLRAQAPEDPEAAGCTRSVTEYAELSSPGLTVRTDRPGLRISGSFATTRRPNGSPPVPTGRVYELVVTASPRDGSAGEGREPATGLLELGGERVSISDEGPNQISYGG